MRGSQKIMHIYKQFLEAVRDVVDGLIAGGDLPQGLLLHAITVEPTKDATHGDMATNAAMVLAKPAGKNPREIAAKIAESLKVHPQIAKVDIAGPGFINLTLKPEIWGDVITAIHAQGTAYGDSDLGAGEKVNIEFVSANPTGPMHIGHARGGVYGDALAGLLEKVGYHITREFYINDAGSQVDTLARSAHLRYREALGESITIPEGYYPGEYLIPVGQALKEKFGDALIHAPEAEWFPKVRTFAMDAMLELIREDLALMGIHHDVFTSELAIRERGDVDAAYAVLESKGLIYQGVLEPPKGKLPDDWEARDQTLFRSTQFGDDVDRPLKKSDGSWTYFAPDIAYHYDKLKRGYKKMILELGVDHAGYQKRLKSAVSALSNDEADITIILHQLVNLMENGEPVKMSKRSGNFLTTRDVVERVGKDVLRFIMLTRKNTEKIDFDFAKVKEQTKDNPVFYVQYAHARANSVLRNAAVENFFPSINNQPLTTNHELALLRKLAEWPRAVEQAAIAHEPHRIAYYLYDLAAQFHGLWALVKFIVPEDKALTEARLAMVKAVAIVVASGLKIFGVTPVESM